LDDLTEEDLGAFRQLQSAIQALSLEPEIQLGLYPNFADMPFELLDDFENWYEGTRWRKNLPISAIQADALKALFDATQKIPEEKLSESSVHSDTSWKDLRVRAGNILALFGWQKVLPPHNKDH
jgi:hypothetical protein